MIKFVAKIINGKKTLVLINSPNHHMIKRGEIYEEKKTTKRTDNEPRDDSGSNKTINRASLPIVFKEESLVKNT